MHQAGQDSRKDLLNRRSELNRMMLAIADGSGSDDIDGLIDDTDELMAD